MAHRQTVQGFIKKAKAIHGNKYDYSRTIYGANNKEEVCIICPVHGDFSQKPNVHILGHGCPKCGAEIRGINKRKNIKTLISEMKSIFPDYDYSHVKSYKDNKQANTIECPIHGVFKSPQMLY